MVGVGRGSDSSALSELPDWNIISFLFTFLFLLLISADHASEGLKRFKPFKEVLALILYVNLYF